VNKLERQMTELLRIGAQEFGVESVKAEFEAEGTRMDELLRLVDMSRTAGLPLTVKIGGCEAIRDLLEAKQIGVRHIVAPMVETPYACEKYIGAKNLVFDEEEQLDTDFLFNMETITAFELRNEIVAAARGPRGAQGIVFGRVDFVGSMRRSRNDINDADITARICELAHLLKEHELDLVMGGGVSIDSLPVIREVAAIYLSRFETRKIVFKADAVNIPNFEQGLLNAVHFELLWLLNKRDYYGRITQEDGKRIDMLETRWRVLSGNSVR
jgi:hypothetical protein